MKVDCLTKNLSAILVCMLVCLLIINNLFKTSKICCHPYRGNADQFGVNITKKYELVTKIRTEKIKPDTNSIVTKSSERIRNGFHIFSH